MLCYQEYIRGIRLETSCVETHTPHLRTSCARVVIDMKTTVYLLSNAGSSQQHILSYSLIRLTELPVVCTDTTNREMSVELNGFVFLVCILKVDVIQLMECACLSDTPGK